MEVFVASALVGVVVGALSGLLGIGGGTLMVPIFRLGFGMTALESTATSLFTIVPTSLVGFATHIKNKTCIPRVGVVCGLAGALTSPAGVILAGRSPATMMASLSPAWLVMLAAALIVAYSSVSMFRKAIRMPKVAATAGTPLEEGAEEVAKENEEKLPEFAFTKKRVAQAIAIGLGAGLASGYVGVGGGFIMVPLFLSVLGIMMRQASGTSLVAVTILAVPGVITQVMLGNVDFIAGIAMAAGSIPGAILGANLTRIVPERQLRFAFGTFLLVSAVALFGNEIAVALGLM